MRSKEWRRYHLERVYIKRLKRFHGEWHQFYTSNGDYIACPSWTDFIGRKDFFFLKTLTTTKNDTKYKSKYSPNSAKRGSRYRDVKPKNQTYRTREKDKELVMKIIKEYYNGY
jgi:uncharacterized protein (DUF2132 family)